MSNTIDGAQFYPPDSYHAIDETAAPHIGHCRSPLMFYALDESRIRAGDEVTARGAVRLASDAKSATNQWKNAGRERSRR